MSIPTEKSIFKTKVLEACIANQQSHIDDLKGRIKALLDTEGLGNEESYDNTERSQQAQASNEINAISKGLSAAQEEMAILLQNRASRNRLQTTVAPGAIVVTDKEIFFVSIGSEQLVVDSRTFVAVSTASSLYQAMKGLTSGNTFQHHRKTYRIIDIY